ncbi:DUF1592 domain-containing protein [Crateriforma conspicua]|uniref:DUF1592 domain-containing protein n=1 Tax=Crateriforma conspicua TaxID=2527996 RepID=UPI00118C7FAD|nr:DUF1592 domain-containing protein [Crateriforma conspicua]QDV66035.1 hypothetical protein Mal65_52080 [Crateriforma conspicua]
MSLPVTIRMERFLTNAFAAILLAVMPMRTDDCSAQSVLPADHEARKAEAEQYFQKSIRPFIKTYCLDCHQNRRPTEAGLSFTPALDTPGHAAFSEKWKKAVARVKAHDMPPEGLDQPSDEERHNFVQWLDQVKYLSPKDPGPFVIRRLTKTEYANTLRDLFGVDPKVADRLPDEVSGEGYLNSLSPLQLEQYLAITDQVVNQVIATDESSPTNWHREWIGKLPSDDSDVRAAVGKIAGSLAKNVYRRPASDDEVAVLLDVFELGRGKGLSEIASLRLMLKAMLVSPQFLFITPAEGTAAPAGIVPLDDHQIASRLSYLLWATMPDAELMALADSKRLHDPPTLKAQVNRMLNDPRSRALFDGFGAQWLGLTDLKTRAFDVSKFPQMTDAMRSAMYDEVRLFFEDVVRNNHSVTRLIDCDYTFLNNDLAEIYGLQDVVSGPEMRRVSLSDRNRGGILGMPGVLAATSFPNRTSPVIRGVWVLQQVLGEQVPSAPPDVPELETQDQQSVANLTLRERTELHRTDPVCANCHQLLDPIGFGLENFDAIGRWRDQDENGLAIDATGELPDGSRFTSPEELKAMIAGRVDDFSRNLLEKLLAYALGRRLEGYDEIVVDELMREIAADDYRMQTIVTAVVTSYPFTHRQTD